MNTIPPNIRSGHWRRLLPWLALLCILASFVVAVARLHPANFFGYTEDDSIYFSSAKAIAEGKGYVLASFPGTPAATKYPVFYPWILSWVWRWNPSFPANLTDAIAISVTFGLVYLTAAFLFLRRLRDISEAEAFLLTAFCALHPLIIFYSGSVLSEIPFAALALTAMLIAEGATQRQTGVATVVCCGLLTGLAMLTRVLGLPIAAGIVVAFVMRRAWRQLLVFSGAVAPFFGVLAWRAIFPRLPTPPVSGAAASSLGWIHTWTYYTSYLNVWKEGVPNTSVFAAMLRNNVISLLRAPADYFISPSLAPSKLAGFIVAVVVTATMAAGILREARNRGPRPIHFVLPFYVSAMLMWNYPAGNRFLIPFLPLFAAGIWIEGKNILRAVRSAIFGGPIAEKILAGVFAVIISIIVLPSALNYAVGSRRVWAQESKRRAAILQEKREAYDWLSRFTAPSARVIAYEDADVYLYNHRLAVRPIVFTTADFYESARLTKTLEHVTDVARAINADYWISANDDYDFEWPDAYAKWHARMREMERVLPLVYSSRHDRVRIYSLECVKHPESSTCDSARSVLFPINRRTAMLGTSLR
ncbi:MAG TPA: hypothetical protein VNE63_05250 [Candidatus Acidoferrales bacterium]|nr:hypothetical protein [Candidatus Acidoferrales bacterium]